MRAASLLLLAAMGCSGSETKVKAGTPDITLSTEALDFGEVVLGHQTTLGFFVGNEGIGDLNLSMISLDGTTSGDFSVVTGAPVVVEPGEEVELQVRYTPDVVGQDYGRLVLVTDDTDHPSVEIALSAFGVEPLVDLDPETLWFGAVPVGETRARTVRLSARGSGTLRLTELALSDGADAVFSVAMPAGVALPYEMSTGLSMEVTVTYAPDSLDPWEAELGFETNDPTSPTVSVQLLGNTADDPTVNAAPVVEITDPDWGDYSLLGDRIDVVASVYDEEDGATSLYCYLLADSVPAGAGGSPDEAGQIVLPWSPGAAGDIGVTVRCLDTDGAVGEDSIDVSVFDPEEPLRYTLTGGDTLFDYWTVDDDVAVYVDGLPVFSDTNRTKDNHPPLEFEARVGSVIRIAASDVNYCTRSLDPLTLHFGTGHSQPLNAGVCESACPDDPCFDPLLSWSAGTFFEESYTVTIP